MRRELSDDAEAHGSDRAGPDDRDEAAADAVAAYKIRLRQLIDRRPSGTRRKLAEAFGTHKSFISQITNPTYRVPLPAQHIPALIRVCRLSEEEADAFLELYARAHPSQGRAGVEGAPAAASVLSIPIPAFSTAAAAQEVVDLIQEFADRVIALAERADRAAREGDDKTGLGGDKPE